MSEYGEIRNVTDERSVQDRPHSLHVSLKDYGSIAPQEHCNSEEAQSMLSGFSIEGLPEVTYHSKSGRMEVNIPHLPTLSLPQDGQRIISGNGAGFNNPAKQNSPQEGPIPARNDYYILPETKQHAALFPQVYPHGYEYRCYPVGVRHGRRITAVIFGAPGNGRGGFEIHAGRQSNGCITFEADQFPGEKGYPSSSNFQKLEAVLNRVKPATIAGKRVVAHMQVVGD